MNRGSAAERGAVQGADGRFNEAPIHESGKSRRWSDWTITDSRFNEAPIHESGKWYQTLADQASRDASMRPRFMNRGSSLASLQSYGLDCGFNEAPIHESGK